MQILRDFTLHLFDNNMALNVGFKNVIKEQFYFLISKKIFPNKFLSSKIYFAFIKIHFCYYKNILGIINNFTTTKV